MEVPDRLRDFQVFKEASLYIMKLIKCAFCGETRSLV